VARIVTEADRYFDRVRPWELARAERAGDHAAGRDLDAILAALLAVARVLATELTPFLPDAAARITGRCVSLAGPLAQPRPLFGTTRAGIG
jgi:methionyl-tRNA synthetase